MKHLLTIAGSDCSGGAGIQADLKTFAAHGTYGMSVLTAVTAQNTCGVFAAQDIEPSVVAAQIDAVFDDIRVDAVKIGMVSHAPIIETIAERLRHYAPPIIVVDPVMVSKSGYNLLKVEAAESLVHTLLPLATLVTPNLPEAECIAGFAVRTEEDMVRAAKAIHALGAANVLVKGGHLEQEADDFLYLADGSTLWLKGERLPNVHTHGTGCTLSSALAANLAKGMELVDAVKAAKEYVTEGIRHGLAIGHGVGPTHHFVELYRKAGVQ